MNLPGLSVLKDMEQSKGNPRDLTHQQLDLLRSAFEDRDVGLFLFAVQIFGYKDLTLDLHLPISRFLGKWGMSLTTKSGVIWTPPTESDGTVTDSWRRLMVCIPRECQHLDDLVQTPSGLKRMGDLVPGDEVCTDQFAVNRVISAEEDEAELFLVTTKSGSRFRATSNHLLQTVSGWKQLGSLEKNEAIAAPRGVYREPPTGLYPYWAGVLTGDGCLPVVKGRRTTPVLESHDPEILDELDRLGVKFRRRNTGTTFSFCHEQWSQLPATLWHGAWDKFIPEEYEGSPEFLRGLFDTDGHVGEQGVVYTTVSEQLARDIKRNLSYCHVFGRLWYGHNHWRVVVRDPVSLKNFRKNIGSVLERKWSRIDELISISHRRSSSRIDSVPPEWKQYLRKGEPGALYHAGIRVDNKYWTSKDKLKEVIRFIGRPGLDWLCEDQIIWDPVVSVEPIGVHPIVVLQVSGDHTYISEGVIQHNCFKTSMATRALALWTLAKDPDATIGIFNEKEENAQSWTAAIAEVVESSVLFQLLWKEMIPPGIGFWDREAGRSRPRGLKWGGTGLKFERPTIGIPELSIEPRGIGGAVTGKHYTHKILDDIIGEKTSDSTALMQDAINWIDHSRPLERPAENGQELVVHTPWAYADVYAHMLKKWPGEYKVHKRHLLEDENGRPDAINGRSIFPQKISTQQAKKMCKTDPFVFHAQYQCQPRAGRTLDFSDDWFRFGKIIYSGREPVFEIDKKYFDPEIFDLESTISPEGPPRLIPLSWMEKALIFDPIPGKESERKKETYCRHGLVVVGKDPWGRRFCLESERADLNETDICHRILQLSEKWAVDKIGIEAVNAFHLYGPLLTFVAEKDWNNELPDLIYVEPEGRQKDQRIRSSLGHTHQNGFWYYNREGTSEAIQELTEFPHCEYKDVSDAQSYTDAVCHRPNTPEEARSVWYNERIQEQARGLTGYGEFF